MKTTWLIPNYSGQHLMKKYLSKVIEAMEKGDELLIIDDASMDSSVDWLVKEFALKQLNKDQITKNHEKDQPMADKNEEGRIKKVSVPHGYFPSQLPDLDVYQRDTKSGQSVKVIALHINHRFAASVNIGFLFAQHETVFLLNTDVVPQKKCLSELQATFKEDVFAVTCLEYESTDKKEKSGKNKLWFERGLFIHSKADDFRAGDTAWASGGSSLYSKSKWLELNGFDKLFYPAYWEDIDISYRARQRGWHVLFEPKAVVYHRHETTNKDVFGEQKMMKMSWKHADAFTWKHATLGQKAQYVLWRPYWLWKRYTFL